MMFRNSLNVIQLLDLRVFTSPWDSSTLSPVSGPSFAVRTRTADFHRVGTFRERRVLGWACILFLSAGHLCISYLSVLSFGFPVFRPAVRIFILDALCLKAMLGGKGPWEDNVLNKG